MEVLKQDYNMFLNIVTGWIGFGFVIFLVLLFIPAPYGKHNRSGWGPKIPNKLGWIIMELPSLVFFSWFFLLRPPSFPSLEWLFFAIWALHYIHRSLVFPFRIRTKGKKMPVLIAVFAIIFNLMNGSLNGLYFSVYSEGYGLDWLYDPRFIAGFLVFITGVVVNLKSDQKLLKLRSSSTNGYKIPKGGFFKYISCPNFFGEILEWTGFALMAWSPAALAFALWTFFNLVPRALDHHRWYKEKFPDYPSNRKAVIPYLL